MIGFKYTLKPLSERQTTIMRFIQDYADQRGGRTPTTREIGINCNISSTSVVSYNLKRLEEHGLIQLNEKTTRGIEIRRRLDADGRITPIRPARICPPLELILRELCARGWTLRLFANMVGDDFDALALVVNAYTGYIDDDDAARLARIFSTSPDVWLNMAKEYRSQTVDGLVREREAA